jgi:hypothetical protein
MLLVLELAYINITSIKNIVLLIGVHNVFGVWAYMVVYGYRWSLSYIIGTLSSKLKYCGASGFA